MLCFKFQQNRIINEEFNYFEEGPAGKGAPIHNFLSQSLLVNICKCRVSSFIKFAQYMKN